MSDLGVGRLNKFGFNDGDVQTKIRQVEGVLSDAGYEVKTDGRGMHNILVVSIKKDGQELIPYDDPNNKFGYTDAREYLPAGIVEHLDVHSPEDE